MQRCHSSVLQRGRSRAHDGDLSTSPEFRRPQRRPLRQRRVVPRVYTRLQQGAARRRLAVVLPFAVQELTARATAPRPLQCHAWSRDPRRRREKHGHITHSVGEYSRVAHPRHGLLARLAQSESAAASCPGVGDAVAARAGAHGQLSMSCSRRVVCLRLPPRRRPRRIRGRLAIDGPDVSGDSATYPGRATPAPEEAPTGLVAASRSIVMPACISRAWC